MLFVGILFEIGKLVSLLLVADVAVRGLPERTGGRDYEPFVCLYGRGRL